MNRTSWQLMVTAVTFLLLLMVLGGVVNQSTQAFSLPTGNKATAAAGKWTIQRVDAPKLFSEMGPRSLQLDSAGHPHIAYGGDFLYYAWHDGSAWQYETVDASRRVGKYTSLVLDASGNPHIAYFDELNGDLKYARRVGGVWQIQTVDSDGVVGKYPSLALDAGRNPCIAYFDETNRDLKYVCWTMGWSFQTVDSTGYVGEYPSLDFDSAGNPHIS